MKTRRMSEGTLSGRMLHLLALLAIMAELCYTADSDALIQETLNAVYPRRTPTYHISSHHRRRRNYQHVYQNGDDGDDDDNQIVRYSNAHKHNLNPTLKLAARSKTPTIDSGHLVTASRESTPVENYFVNKFDIDLDSTTVSLRPSNHLKITCFVEEKLEKKKLGLWTPQEEGEQEIIVEIVMREGVSGATKVIAEFELPNTHRTFLGQNENASVTSKEVLQKETQSKSRQHTLYVLIPDAGCNGKGFYRCRMVTRVHLRDMTHMELVSTRLQKEVILDKSCGGEPGGGSRIINDIERFGNETGFEMKYGEEFDFTWLCRTSRDLGIRQCYQYSKIPATWSDAEEICQSQGGHLASIKNSAENAMVQLVVRMGRVRDPDGRANVWIGLKEEITPAVFRWSNRQAIDYSNWALGQPALTGTQRKCVLAKTDEVKQWQTQNCDAIVLFICETYDRNPIDSTPIKTDETMPQIKDDCKGVYWSKRRDKCYKYFPDLVDWSAGKILCRNEGGRMVTLETIEEYIFIMINVHAFVGDKYAWTGLRKDKNFTWDSGRYVASEFLGFLTSGPSNLWGNETTGCYSFPISSKHPLVLQQCDQQYGVICEVYIRDKTREDRLAIPPGDLDPDKFEPDVDEDTQDGKPVTPGGPMDVDYKVSDLEQRVNEDVLQNDIDFLSISHLKQGKCNVGWNRLTKTKCYKYIGSAATWYDAKIKCHKMDSSLVTFETGDELSVIHERYGFLITGLGAWTGLRNDGQFTWDSNRTVQEGFLESAFGPGSLERITQKRGCFYLQKSDEKQLSVGDCKQALPYICEFYINQRKTFVQEKFIQDALEQKVNSQDDFPNEPERKTTEERVIVNTKFLADDIERAVNEDLDNQQQNDEKHSVAGGARKALSKGPLELSGSRRRRRRRRRGRKGLNNILGIGTLIKDIVSDDPYEMESLHGRINNKKFTTERRMIALDDLERGVNEDLEPEQPNDEKHTVAGGARKALSKGPLELSGSRRRRRRRRRGRKGLNNILGIGTLIKDIVSDDPYEMESLHGRINNKKFTTERRMIALDDLERGVNEDLEPEQPNDEKHTVAGGARKSLSKGPLELSGRRRRRRRGRKGWNNILGIGTLIKDIVSDDPYEMESLHGRINNKKFPTERSMIVLDDLERGVNEDLEAEQPNDEKHSVAGGARKSLSKGPLELSGSIRRRRRGQRRGHRGHRRRRGRRGRRGWKNILGIDKLIKHIFSGDPYVMASLHSRINNKKFPTERRMIALDDLERQMNEDLEPEQPNGEKHAVVGEVKNLLQ